MGFFGSLFGTDQADAARQAAQDTYTKQLQAARNISNFGDQYAQNFQNLSQSYAPYTQTGLSSNAALQRLISDPSSLSSLPGYQFQLDQGINALDRSAAARGMLNSGRQSKDLLRFGQGLADSTYGSQLARLMALNQQGIGATGAQVGTQAQGLQGQLGTRQTAYQGQYGAAPTIGQGITGAANAQGQGAANIFNLASSGIGELMGLPSFGGGSLPTGALSRTGYLY